VLLWLLAGATLACSQNEYVAPPPPTVTVANPVVQDVTDYLAYTGRARAVESVQVQARVKGFLQSMHYVPGSQVKKGDLLFIIDPKPFEVEVAAREADLSSRRADAALAKTSYARSQQLFRQNATSEIENLRFKAERDKANAAVLAAQAALADAQLDLDYAYVKSPIDGRAGRHLVDLGNLVGAEESTVLVSVVDQSPLFIYFQISELDVLRVQRQLRERAAAAAAATSTSVDEPPTEPEEAAVAGDEGTPAPGDSDSPDYEPQAEADPETIEPTPHGYEASGGTRYGRDPGPNTPPVEVGLSDEEGYPRIGFLDFTDSTIDPATGTLEVRGILENKGEFESLILPGSFTRVRVPVGKFEDALLVPDHALGADQGGRFVLVVGEGDVVEQRYVQLGLVYDGMRRIVSGLIPTDRVVVNGLQRARPGATVTVRTGEPDAPASAAAAPAPPAE